MRTLLLSTVVVLVSCVALAQEPKSPRAQKLAKMQQKFETELKDLEKKLAEAKEADEKQQLGFLIKELHAFAADDALELADEGKKDETALDAAVFALKLLGKVKLTGEKMDKAIALVLDNHIDSPKVQPVLEHMSDIGPNGLQFLKTVAEKTSNKEVQALALFYNAMALDNQASGQEGTSTDEFITRLRDEAVELMEKAVKIAPDVKIGADTLTKAVANEMVSMKIGVGKPVPDVEGVDLDGKKVKLSSYKGKVVLFDFWATWCPPCVAMIPHEREMVGKLSAKPFALLSVNVDADRAQFTEFLEREKMPWHHWVDGGKGPLAKMFKVRAFPTLYLIDAKGIVRKKWIGSPGNDKLDAAIADLIAEAEKGK